jgi:hypothetical protein
MTREVRIETGCLCNDVNKYDGARYGLPVHIRTMSQVGRVVAGDRGTSAKSIRIETPKRAHAGRDVDLAFKLRKINHPFFPPPHHRSCPFPHNRANSQESDGASNDDEVSDGTGCSKLGPTKTTANESATTATT